MEAKRRLRDIRPSRHATAPRADSRALRQCDPSCTVDSGEAAGNAAIAEGHRARGSPTISLLLYTLVPVHWGGNEGRDTRTDKCRSEDPHLHLTSENQRKSKFAYRASGG